MESALLVAVAVLGFFLFSRWLFPVVKRTDDQAQRDRRNAGYGASNPTFVSSDAWPYVLTKPVKVTTPNLTLNIWTTEYGAAGVEVLDGKGRPIPGYTFDECHKINSDQLRARINWRDKVDLAELVGQTVQLKFVYRYGCLYSWGFDP